MTVFGPAAPGVGTGGGADAGVAAPVRPELSGLYSAPGPIARSSAADVASAFFGAERWLLVGAARLVLGVTLTIFPAGSGDTTYNYIELAFELALAIVVATGWHAAVRGRPVSARTQDHVTIFVRYVLGATMLSYGWIKILPVQMPAPGPDRLLTPIGDTSPMGLLWTFMGASAAYQMFAGLGEALGGVLLFWRRTTLLGSLILTGVLANVVALNFCFDVPVKLYSSHLLAMALFIMAPHAPRLLAVLLLNRPAASCELRPFPLQRPWVRRAALAVKAGLVLIYAGLPIASSYDGAQAYGFLAPRPALHGLYRVTAFTRGGVAGGALKDEQRWVRVGIGARLAVQRADGTTERWRLTISTRRATRSPSCGRRTTSGSGCIRRAPAAAC